MFKSPMLAPNKCADINRVVFPVLCSPKLDGIRAVVLNGRLMSRTLKPIPNEYAQKLFSKLPEGTDGELVLGDPTHKDAYRNTVSAVMSIDGEPGDLFFHIFDNFMIEAGFQQRFDYVKKSGGHRMGVKVVPHTMVRNIAELEAFEFGCLEQGYEGAMIRKIDGPYKQGRATLIQAYLLKLKRYVFDAEAEILDSYEQMHNDNEAFTNELGRTARSTMKAGMVGKNKLGGFEVRDCKSGVEFCIGSGFNDEERCSLWALRKTMPGQFVKYKYFPTGSKDKPRHPIFLGFRMKEDM